MRSPSHADFFRTVCARFAAAGRLQLLVLSGGGIDIAWKVNFVAGDTVFCFKIAYDPEFARFSPGVQLELDFVDLFHGTQLARERLVCRPRQRDDQPPVAGPPLARDAARAHRRASAARSRGRAREP